MNFVSPEVLLTDNTGEGQHFSIWLVGTPTAIGSSHLEFNLMEWPMIFSPSYLSCVSSRISNQELLITGWTESHRQARDTSQKQPPASGATTVYMPHRKLDKAGLQYFESVAGMQAFGLRSEGHERQAAFTTSLAPPPPGSLVNLWTPVPTPWQWVWRGSQVREAVGTRNNSLNKLHIRSAPSLLLLSPHASSMSLFLRIWLYFNGLSLKSLILL